jgi:hypothetical protein
MTIVINGDRLPQKLIIINKIIKKIIGVVQKRAILGNKSRSNLAIDGRWLKEQIH